MRRRYPPGEKRQESMMVARYIFVLACGLGICGCAQEAYTLKKGPTEPQFATTMRLDLIATNYRAIDALVGQIRPALPTNAPVIVSTVVNLNHLESASPLGRVISEHVLGRFAQSGYGVIELKVRNQLYMKRHEGEFLLTREIKELARSHNAQALVIGTYVEASDRVFVSLKVIEAEGSRIIGAVDYAIIKDEVVRSLLARNGY